MTALNQASLGSPGHRACARRHPEPNGRSPNSYIRIDRDYDTIRAGPRALFTDLGIQTAP
jgi:hypothetical protein